jgi:hypothetical protein
VIVDVPVVDVALIVPNVPVRAVKMLPVVREVVAAALLKKFVPPPPEAHVPHTGIVPFESRHVDEAPIRVAKTGLVEEPVRIEPMAYEDEPVPPFATGSTPVN